MARRRKPSMLARAAKPAAFAGGGFAGQRILASRLAPPSWLSWTPIGDVTSLLSAGIVSMAAWVLLPTRQAIPTIAGAALGLTGVGSTTTKAASASADAIGTTIDKGFQKAKSWLQNALNLPWGRQSRDPLPRASAWGFQSDAFISDPGNPYYLDRPEANRSATMDVWHSLSAPYAHMQEFPGPGIH